MFYFLFGILKAAKNPEWVYVKKWKRLDSPLDP